MVCLGAAHASRGNRSAVPARADIARFVRAIRFPLPNGWPGSRCLARPGDDVFGFCPRRSRCRLFVLASWGSSMRSDRRMLAATLLIAGVATATPAGGGAQAAKFKVLESFGHKLGDNPAGSVLIDSAGNLYGTAANFGPQQGGTVYELKRKGGGYKAISIFRFCIRCG